MSRTRKPDFEIAALMAAILLVQNCAWLGYRPSQKISVTSDPRGATATIDGQERGPAPLIARLKKNRDHVIRIESPGYNPAEIRVKSRPVKIDRGTMAADFLLAFPIGPIIGGIIGAFVGVDQYGHRDQGAKTGASIGLGIGVVSVILDSRDYAYYTLEPFSIVVTLKEGKVSGLPTTLVLDAEKFQSLTWIRIRLSDKPGDEFWPR
jgi:hypothetical protein